MKNKKGIAGLDWFKTFIIALTVIAVLLFALALTGSSLRSSVSADTANGRLSNETQTLRSTGNNTSVVGLTNIQFVLSTVIVTNATSGVIIPASNWSMALNGTLFGNASSGYLTRLVNVTGNYTYSTPSQTQNVIGNFSDAVEDTGAQFDDWVSLAILVVLLGLIGVAIYLVQRFGKDRLDYGE